jgi:hypothetical protein
MTDDISIEAKINNMNPETIRREQKQELFECIRHFMKYMSYENLSDEFKLPEEAITVREAIISLYENQFEKSDHDKPE